MCFDTMPLPVMVTDADLVAPGPRILYANPALCRLTGFAEAELLGNSPRLLQGPATDRGAMRSLKETLDSGRVWQGSTVNYRKDGTPFLMGWCVSHLRATDGTLIGYISVQDNLTDRRAEADARVREAERDPAVGLLTQPSLIRRLAELVRLAEEGTAPFPVVLAVQFDHLGALSAPLTELALAAFMAEHGRRLTAAVGYDRVGFVAPDRFLVVCPDIDRIAMIRDNLQVPVTISGVRYHASATIGMAIYPVDGGSAEALTRAAVLAATDSQRRGATGKLVPFQQDTAERVARAAGIERSLRAVHARERFSVRFRPIARIATSQVIGVEAMPEWHDPDLGIVGADELLPVAEAASMLSTIGSWTIEAAVGEFGQTVPSTRDVMLVLDIGAGQVGDSGRTRLLAAVADALHLHGLGHHQLVLSVPARVLTQRDVLHTLMAIRTIGARIAVDGLGRPGVDFTLIADAPVDFVKLDPAMVRSMRDSRRAQTVCRGLVGLAQDLGLTVLALGVLSNADRERLADVGCDLGVGPVFGPPSNVADALQVSAASLNRS
ncbi:MAG: EAL domain-containing protein [Alphaproteobacteria bacterium]|nr:MAG: EAL domain-containing protein [Alphaproteobacteria bacterium]